MINTLYLPELREMLAESNADELREFCTALHPGRTAEFMEGLTASEAWEVLQYADDQLKQEIFSYLEPEMQIAIVESQDRAKVADFIADVAPDDRVDILDDVHPDVVSEIMPMLPAEERRDILRLQSYPEDTAGGMMTTEVARLHETSTAKQALDELGRQSEELETIYYFYVVDETNQLRGVVSARELIVTYLRRPDVKLGEIMETDIVSVSVDDDQEKVASVVAKYDLLVIPVIDHEHHLLGIITHDDVIDVVIEEATEDAHRSAAVEPLEESYLRTRLVTLSWKRGLWLTILFFAALLTAFALQRYEIQLEQWGWLVYFIPLVISSGGNTGSQSATLVITAMATGDVSLSDWRRVLLREMLMGLMLGGFLAAIGFFPALFLAQNPRDAFVVPITLLFVVVCGTLLGSMLPLLFQRLGLDPALMSNPFVAGIIDILGIVIYLNVAILLLS